MIVLTLTKANRICLNKNQTRQTMKPALFNYLSFEVSCFQYVVFYKSIYFPQI